jgi:hypothetical protein
MLKKIIIIVSGVVLVGVGYYFISPLFISVTLYEPEPVEVNVPATISETDVVKTELLTNLPNKQSTEVASRPTDTASVALQAPILPVYQAEAQIVGTRGHDASGTVRIVKTEAGEVARFEDFKTVNGPDLFVYLASDLEATKFVDLGRLKATEGNINYLIPTEVDITQYPYVMVWCKQFGVLFNYAQIYP